MLLDKRTAIQVIEIRPRVWLIGFDDQYRMTSTFMRLQEFYESPLPGIKGRFFTHERFLDAYAASRPDGRFSYFEDWGGFNVPGNVVRRFHRLFINDLWVKERNLFELVRKHIPGWNTRDDYYLIGTPSNNEIALRHELAHAYWYLNPSYRRAMQSVLKRLLSTQARKDFRDRLLKLGYMAGVIGDEIQAIMSAGSESIMAYGLAFRLHSALAGACCGVFDEHDSAHTIASEIS